MRTTIGIGRREKGRHKVPVVLTRGAEKCSECILLKGAFNSDGQWCALHHPELDDRDVLVLHAFVAALLERRVTHSGPGGESLTYSIHVVKRRFLRYHERQ